MRRAFDERIVNDAFYYIPHQNLVYFNNPKVACSTIKANMWRASDRALKVKTYPGNPHLRGISPFVKEIYLLDAASASRLDSAVSFSVVRNPFVRILSAYLDKVGEDRVVWQWTTRRFGLEESITKTELSFRDFVAIISTEPDELLDTHFRPQYINILWPLVTPDFLGHLENFEEVIDFLERNNIRSDSFKVHATNAKALLDAYYSDEVVEMVRNKFSDDFRIFGYSTDIARIDDFGAVEPGVPGCGNLYRWIQQNEYPYELADEKTRTFKRFLEIPGRNREERLSILLQAYPDDDNWRRLQTYGIYAIQVEEFPLAKSILERIRMLRTRHYDLVEDKSMFLDGVTP